MGTDYEIQQGDCLASIARHSGLLWGTIWNRPENSDLRTLRVARVHAVQHAVQPATVAHEQAGAFHAAAVAVAGARLRPG